MAKESMKAREVKRAKLVAKYAEKRAALKKIVNGVILQGNLDCTLRSILYELVVQDVTLFEENLGDFLLQI